MAEYKRNWDCESSAGTKDCSCHVEMVVDFIATIYIVVYHTSSVDTVDYIVNDQVCSRWYCFDNGLCHFFFCSINLVVHSKEGYFSLAKVISYAAG